MEGWYLECNVDMALLNILWLLWIYYSVSMVRKRRIHKLTKGQCPSGYQHHARFTIRLMWYIYIYVYIYIYIWNTVLIYTDTYVYHAVKWFQLKNGWLLGKVIWHTEFFHSKKAKVSEKIWIHWCNVPIKHSSLQSLRAAVIIWPSLSNLTGQWAVFRNRPYHIRYIDNDYSKRYDMCNDPDNWTRVIDTKEMLSMF